MVYFSTLDVVIILTFFALVLLIGYYSGHKLKDDAEDYLLSSRKVGLFLFILTNVSTWYGGILGVGEFTYNYGLVSWFTQGLPYYIFAFLFAIFFAKKIHNASLFTIPDKLEQVYGKQVSLFASALIFILVSPAPYLLMLASLISLIFKINIIISLIACTAFALIYMIKGGYKSDLYTDAIQFFVMFAGFIIIVYFSYKNYGGIDFLKSRLPAAHLDFTGGTSPSFIIVWFLIALWTFADPGFHQRCYAAKTGNVAKYGILISILLWAFFDFLTTTTGLFSRALIPNIVNPVLSFPYYAEKVLTSGFKGLFYAGLFASILSTFNSFLFLSGTTFSRDFIFKFADTDESKLKLYTIVGLILSGVVSVIIAYLVPSVIRIWYIIGSLCVPAIILPVVSAYYSKLRIAKKFMLVEMIFAFTIGVIWYGIRNNIYGMQIIQDIEPMIVSLLAASILHTIFLQRSKN
ncbi:MAG TPA: sodium:solute symporter family protein [Ignavibacteriaceae bacterium]|nr:sodium:solute symporter family protein [Ignavibacteriaceae bacterium]